jgi:diacylglycerol kinase (ATP)
MLKSRILFIVNPISGGRRKNMFSRLVESNLDPSRFDTECVYSEYVGHARALAEAALEEGIDIIAAVGGDGTINEIASVIEGTHVVLAIIPLGSGNGLARFLNIPLNTVAAVKSLNGASVQSIDSAALNGRKFFNMAGIGFDAHISAHFAKNRTRGFAGYIKTTLKEIYQYKSQVYKIEIDELLLERKAFMISLANSAQYGNNAYVSPAASIKDGLLDLCIIRPFPLYYFPVIVYHMFNKTSNRSKYVEIIPGKQIRICREVEGPVHLDGESEIMGTELNIEVKPLSLTIFR